MWSKLKNFASLCWFPIAILFILIAILSSLFRALTPWATQYKGEVEQHLSHVLGKPVSIEKMETGWYWFEPVVKLHDIVIKGDLNQRIELKNLLVGINIFSSVRHWQIQPGILYIDNVHLKLREQQGQWQIQGINLAQSPAVQWDSSLVSPVLNWIFSQQKIMLKDISATLVFENKSQIVVNSLNLRIVKKKGLYYLQGSASLDEQPSTTFKVQGDLKFNPSRPLQSAGHAYLSINRLQVSQLQKILPLSDWNIISGSGDVQIWADWKKGYLENMQGQLSIPVLKWQDPFTRKKQIISALQTDFIWLQNKNRWELSFPKFNVNWNNQLWPLNKVLVSYQQETQTYQVYIAKLLIEPLFKNMEIKNALWHKLKTLHLKGQLYDTQFHIQSGTIPYILTQVDALSWKGQGAIPSITNLSGVVHWEPLEGQVELDAKEMTIFFPGKPLIQLPQLSAGINWKELSDGLRLSVDHFVINHPDLLFNFNGNMDEVSAKSLGNLQLAGQLSAHHLEKWLKYLPENHLKPKLEAWLKNDIKKMENVVAELQVQGLAKDFPFDQGPGDFSIKGYIDGADVIFAPNWPLSTDLAAYFQVTKRLLNIDLVRGNFQGILVDNGNFQIQKLGLNRETLLVHSQIMTQAKDALHYVLNSPLNKKLNMLSILDLAGDLELDLHLEIPLYPGNDELLTAGTINFNDNTVVVNHILDHLQFDHFKGILQFTEAGIRLSQFTSELWQSPMHLSLQSLPTTKPGIGIQLEGRTSIAGLKSQFPLSFLQLAQGETSLQGQVTLTDANDDFDTIALQSTLEGIRIRLPKPFGKESNEKTPLQLGVKFNQEKALDIRFKYNKQIDAALSYTGKKGQFTLDEGQIVIGKAPDVQYTKKGLALLATLPYIDSEEWKKAFANLPKSDSDASLFNVLQFIHLFINEFVVEGHHYLNLNVSVNKEPDNWAIRIDQSLISAFLHYYPHTHRLEGVFERLSLPDSFKRNESSASFSPQEIPDLDLTIHSLSIAYYDLGAATLKGHHQNNGWALDSATVSTPYYGLSMHGLWEKNKTSEKSVLAGQITIHDLAKTLLQFKISPVVEANKGAIQFEASWPKGLSAFSIQHLVGQFAIQLKDGRITHLSKETEEKLGFGKLLSILSLQTIPRRLKLDFSDLAEGGYSFDEFKGNFSIHKGLMSTKNSTVDGPIAYATMVGDLNIVKQLYDVDLAVYPHITASLPVVATIAGGPVAGLATWVASKLLSQEVQKISGYTYKISGPWRNPIVQQVNFIKPSAKN